MRFMMGLIHAVVLPSLSVCGYALGEMAGMKDPLLIPINVVGIYVITILMDNKEG